MAATLVSQARFAGLYRRSPRRLPRAARRLRILLMLRRNTRAALGYGVLSGLLYFVLYYFNDAIRAVAEMTYGGDKTYFLLPIAVAFVFSIVHGLFTDRFWEAMGLKARR